MNSYLQSHDRTEQRGRAEDGPVGLKHKWTDWPHVTPQANLLNAGAKKKPKSGVTNNIKPTSTKTSNTQSTTGAPKK